jgi:hypothetical protein
MAQRVRVLAILVIAASIDVVAIFGEAAKQGDAWLLSLSRLVDERNQPQNETSVR